MKAVIDLRKINIYGEILYVGLVAEKGRVFSELWKYNYRKTLKLHVGLWQRILNRMTDNDYTKEDEQLLMDFNGLYVKIQMKSGSSITPYLIMGLNLLNK
jgi:hypothetical protein